MEAVLTFTKSELNKWRGKFPEFVKHIEKVGRICTNATGQFASRPDCVIVNAYGKATLTFLATPGSLGLWNYHTGAGMKDYADIPPEKELEEIIENVTKGLHYCDSCKKWFPHEKMRSYSFAGTVCHKCFNPKIHLPPDTRGD